MIKILGALFIFLSCAGLAKNRINKYRNSSHTLNSIIAGLREMSDSILFLKETLPEIVSSLAQRKNDVFFKKVSQILSADETINIETAWDTALNDDFLSIAAPAKEVLSNLGKTIGKQTAKLEKENITICINSLNEILKNENELCRNNIKTIKSLGILTGLMIVILFI